MLTEPTQSKLAAMRLHGMLDAWREQQSTTSTSKLSFDERFALLVDAEELYRENRRLTRYMREAKLRIANACIEDVDFAAGRNLDRAVVRQLASCRWITEQQNVTVTGATGVGKTYLACALAHQACRKGHRAIYRRASRFFDELTLARADGTYERLLSRLARVDVLVIDDWGLAPMKPVERRDLLEVLEDRYATRSTIITSQLPTSKWHEHIGDPTLADAICDRVLHNAHKILLKGPSRRKDRRKKK
ncbi:MAG: IS21-like element helper ATPase IstB [Parvibaculum sp.]